VVLRYVRKSLGMAEQHKHISAHIVLCKLCSLV
jgi:hypothetical protein